MPHALDRNDVDLAVLADDLGARLGRRVALTARVAQTVDEAVYEDVVEEVPRFDATGREVGVERVVIGERQTGTRRVDLPGVLLVVDPLTGQEVDVDGRTVAAAVRAHTPPPTAEQQRADRITAAERKARAGDTAGALADVLALLRQSAV